MSLCIRPVVETWGESITYSSRETDIWERLEQLADLAGIDSTNFHSTQYGNDLTVFWVYEGGKFLDFLSEAGMGTRIVNQLETEELLSGGAEEREREAEDLRDICAMAESWRKSIDPADGSLRIYCD